MTAFEPYASPSEGWASGEWMVSVSHSISNAFTLEPDAADRLAAEMIAAAAEARRLRAGTSPVTTCPACGWEGGTPARLRTHLLEVCA